MQVILMFRALYNVVMVLAVLIIKHVLFINYMTNDTRNSMSRAILTDC